MSFLTKIKTTVENSPKGIAATKGACRELGLQFIENQKTFRMHARTPSCEHAIRLAGCDYEIGLVRQEDGSLTFAYDHWGPGRALKEKLGDKLQKLVQHYGINRAILVARAKGLMTQRIVQPNGAIKLKLTGAGL